MFKQMLLYRQVFLLIISAVLLFTSADNVIAQTLFPENVGDKARYSALIVTPKAYLSGICILYYAEDELVNGSLFNEFGISALDFSYNMKKDKVKLHHVLPQMNKWYIRRVLRKDLRSLLHELRSGKTEYIDKRYHLSYRLTLIKAED